MNWTHESLVSFADQYRKRFTTHVPAEQNEWNDFLRENGIEILEHIVQQKWPDTENNRKTVAVALHQFHPECADDDFDQYFRLVRPIELLAERLEHSHEQHQLDT